MHSRKRLLILLGLFTVMTAALIGGIWWFVKDDDNQTTARTPRTAATATVGSTAAPAEKQTAFDRGQYPLDTPSSPWIIVNKHRPLNPVDYAPPLASPDVPRRLPAGNPEMQLSRQAVPAVEELFAAAKSAGLALMLASGYRSYAEQVSVYGAEVKANGQAGADRESARPGYSEHQTGLALDIEPVSRQCEVEQCFADTPEGKWLAANGYRYGFVIRYGQTLTAITGYTFEPWHLRYVGKPLAAELHAEGGPALETFFGFEAAPDYR